MTAATTPGEQWQLGYRPALDGLRGIAILLVLGAHFHVRPLADGGTVGVTLFFVLSGFLITSLLVAEHARRGRIHLLAFYKRRVLRLFPALLVFVAVSVALLILTGRQSEAFLAVPVLFYGGNWVLAVGGDLGPLEHTWTLAVEEQFYIVWPLLLIATIAVGRYGAALTLALIGGFAGLVWRHVLWPPVGQDFDPRVAWATDSRMDALLIGCALAFVVRAGWRPRHPRLMAALALGTQLIVAADLDRLMPVRGWSLTWSLLAAVPLVWVASTVAPRWLSLRPLVLVGVVSYGIYLWHNLAVDFLPLAEVSLPLRFVIGITSTAILAFISYRYVEQPFLRMKRKVTVADSRAAQNALS